MEHKTKLGTFEVVFTFSSSSASLYIHAFFFAGSVHDIKLRKYFMAQSFVGHRFVLGVTSISIFSVFANIKTGMQSCDREIALE